MRLVLAFGGVRLFKPGSDGDRPRRSARPPRRTGRAVRAFDGHATQDGSSVQPGLSYLPGGFATLLAIDPICISRVAITVF